MFYLETGMTERSDPFYTIQAYIIAMHAEMLNLSTHKSSILYFSERIGFYSITSIFALLVKLLLKILKAILLLFSFNTWISKSFSSSLNKAVRPTEKPFLDLLIYYPKITSLFNLTFSIYVLQ